MVAERCWQRHGHTAALDDDRRGAYLRPVLGICRPKRWRSGAVLGAAAVFVGLLLVVAAAVRADDERQRQTLAGLMGVSIVVEDVNPAAEKDGLTAATLHADTQQKLREAGVAVLTEDQATRAPGTPHLYLKLSAIRHGGGFYAYHIQVSVRQRVILLRASRGIVFATTWSAPEVLGTVAWANLPSIRDDVKAKVDQFIKAYFAVNPAPRPR
jgi:hypothetical protein